MDRRLGDNILVNRVRRGIRVMKLPGFLLCFCVLYICLSATELATQMPKSQLGGWGKEGNAIGRHTIDSFVPYNSWKCSSSIDTALISRDQCKATASQ